MNPWGFPEGKRSAAPVLALDCAGSTGWAVTPYASGTWDIRPKRGDSPGMRYIYLRQKLDEVRKAFPDLERVVYEQAHHRGGAATEYAGGYAATIQAWCAEHKLEHQAVHTATIKRHATGGKGKASKEDMVRLARARWPAVPIQGDDHADALFLLDFAANGSASHG